jgi:predicted GIY-YIG superfamily endonuclease
MHILYQIRFPTTGQVYYGVTVNLHKRTKQHMWHAARGSHGPLYDLARRLDYMPALSVVQTYESRSEALLGERETIREARQAGVSLNLARGGDGRGRAMGKCNGATSGWCKCTVCS